MPKRCLCVCMDNEGLYSNFAHLTPPILIEFTHLPRGEEQVRVVLEERIGRFLWVRPLDEGEIEPPGPISVQPGEVVVPYTPIHSTSIHTSPTVGDTTGFILGIPVVEVRRDDALRKVWIRTVRISEPEPPGRVRWPWGYDLTIEPGDIALEIERIDRLFPPDEDGYVPLTNTIWTWFNIGPAPGSEMLTRYVLAAARRLDAAHRQFQRVRKELDDFDPVAPGPLARRTTFEIVGQVETAVVALSRAVDMSRNLVSLVPIPVSVPENVTDKSKALTELRNAYEHIEDRAKGQVWGKPDPQALTIFDWSSLFESGTITYGGHSLVLDEVQELILDTRAFLVRAASEAKEVIADGSMGSSG